MNGIAVRHTHRQTDIHLSDFRLYLSNGMHYIDIGQAIINASSSSSSILIQATRPINSVLTVPTSKLLIRVYNFK